MVARYVFVNGVGLVDLLGSAGPVAPEAPSGTVLINGNLESAAVQSPMTRETLWAFTGRANYGQASNLVNTRVVQTDGPGGVTSKVWEQNFPAVVSGSTSNYAMPPTGTGIALTSLKLPTATEHARISYDVRFLSDGPPFGWGGKLWGLGGIGQGRTSVPTGGQPSPYGWSCRPMFRGAKRGSAGENNLTANAVFYMYEPQQPSGTVGGDRQTGKQFVRGQWHHIEQEFVMNSVASPGVPVANGIHRGWIDGVQCWEKLDQVFRVYTDAMVTHAVLDNFYGGDDEADNSPWGPKADTRIQFDNLVVTAY